MSSKNQYVLLHEIVHSEITYGMIALRKTDGSLRFFSELPETFTINFRGNMLYERTHHVKKVWLGKEITRKIRPGEILKIYRKGKIVYID
jgi:hypothetical protein